MPVESSKHCGNTWGLPVVTSGPSDSQSLNRFYFVYVSISLLRPYSGSISQLWSNDGFVCNSKWVWSEKFHNHKLQTNPWHREEELLSLVYVPYRCIVTINVLWLFLTVPLVGLQCVIVVFPEHTHLLFDVPLKKSESLVPIFLVILSTRVPQFR